MKYQLARTHSAIARFWQEVPGIAGYVDNRDRINTLADDAPHEGAATA